MEKPVPCKMSNCEKPCFRLGVCAEHWAWLTGAYNSIQETLTRVASKEQP